MELESAQHSAESLRGPFGFSLAFHFVLLGLLVLSSVLTHRGELGWGAPGGGAVTLGLVGTVPGISLPRPEVVSTNRVVDETKGLYKSEEKPKEPETDVTPIPKFERNKPPRYITRPSHVLENPTPPPPGAIPYGGGGTPTIPYTSFTMGAGMQAGLGFSGTGGGDFGARYPWYVEAVQRRISSNWLQSTVDPAVRFAPRVVVDFQVLRDGSVTNVQLVHSSGNSSVDLSAIRAIRESSPLDRLPGDYAGSNVNVEFSFEFHR